MTDHISQFADFLACFDKLKGAAKGDPQRISVFYKESKPIREAVDSMAVFLLFTDFERRVFHGPKKHILQAPERFEPTWNEYRKNWNDIVMSVYVPAVDELVPEWEGGQQVCDDFDPRYHDGGRWIEDGMMYFGNLRNAPPDDDPETADCINMTLGAFDYLTDTIGINISDIFQRWRKVPITFMPAHVSNKHGLREKGSLYDLMDDAVRAYVCGAPAAAIAMCRAALETVLKVHYGKGQWGDLKLGKMIVLASQRFDFVDAGRLQRLTDNANGILHHYSKRSRMSEQDDRTILEFMKTVKFLIQRAPG